MATKVKQPLVSIVIPTKNSATTIATCLNSIKKQTYPNIEIIVVDDESTDNTTEIIKKLNVHVFERQHAERSVQRNFGIGKSKGKYIAWFDSDMKLDPGVISECVNILTKTKRFGAIIIPEASVGQGFWTKCRILEKKCYLNDPKIEAARFTSRKILFNIGGFSENFISGEDWDITSRLRNSGIEIGRSTKFVYHNEGRINLINNLAKKYYYATKSLPYIERHVKKTSDLILFVFRPAFFRNWRLLIRHPLLTLGMIIMKTLEFTCGLIGFVIAKTKRLR